MKALMVDDDQELCTLVGEYLARHGWELHTTGTGPDGLRQMVETKVDLVVLDVMLPGLDGVRGAGRTCRSSC